MPVVLTPELFMAPPDGKGAFRANMFPDGDRDEWIDKLIEVAPDEVSALDDSVQQRAAEAYINWRLWDYLAGINQANAESITLDSGRTAIKFGTGQRGYYQSKANQAKALYDDYFTYEDEFITA